MAICQFFLRGTCRFGDNCRNEHPANAAPSAFGNTGWGKSNTAATSSNTIFPYSAVNIANDLNPAGEKPLWPLSSYAPAKHEPLLLSGLDESPEELRVKAAEAIRNGKLNEYLAYESSKIAAADQVYNDARLNSDNAFEQAKKVTHFPEPGGANKTSAFASSSAFPNTSTSSVFGNPSTTTVFGKPASTSVFGQPAFGQTSTPGTTSVFGNSGFGQPQQQTTSTFGQPTSTTAISAFGQPSVFGQASPNPNPLIKPASGAFSAFSGSGPSAFGSAAGTEAGTSGGGGGFSAFTAQPSASGLGLPNQQTGGSIFGQTRLGQAAPATTAAFGQPAPSVASVFGQPAGGQTPSAFGQPVNGTPTSAFGQPAGGTATSVFGQPASGTTSVFSAPAASHPQSTSVFGQPSAFGAQQQQSSSPFGSTSTATPTSVFGKAAAPTTTSVFGQSAFPNPPQLGTPSPFGAPASGTTTTVFGNTQPASTSAFGGGTISAQTQGPSLGVSHTMSMEMKSATPSQPDELNFTLLKSVYKARSAPYHESLPKDYMDLIPKVALEAFTSAKFEFWKVPEYISPLELR